MAVAGLRRRRSRPQVGFERVTDKVGADDTPIGSLPKAADLDVDGLDLGDEEVPQLLRVDLDAWLEETESIAGHLAKFGDNRPPELTEQLTALRSRVNDELAAHPEHAP